MNRVSLIVIAALTCASCTSSLKHTQEATEPTTAKRTEGIANDSVRYVEQGRYTLLSVEPRPEQIDLLKQIIDIRIPTGHTPAVRGAMLHVLQRTGYSLCAGSASQAALFSRPLPAAHYNLGPMPLSSALQVLAGPSWNLLHDDVQRTVCFELREAKQP
ncbi:PilL N-terminal domain-containing protein [Pseudomonas sp. LRF_L74]|uniref:PFGI-1 class ICE element type IV pilus protein PilL2 n=1 Tax=Pseudomonas sp. LRF_L74 TaxID=3369422 RepID=UPI003F5FE872